MKLARLAAVVTSLLVTTASPSFAEGDKWLTTTTLINPSKYGETFKQYDYVNVNAPKGGTFNAAVQGTFDSFNPFIVKGDPAAGLTFFGGILWDTLMEQSVDEPSVSHPLIAEAYKHPADYSSATYRLNKMARWHDGTRITPEDVKWSMETLKEHSPQHTRYFANVKTVTVLNETDVLFEFDQVGNRELPHIIGDLPVLSKNWWTGTGKDGKPRDFTKTGLEPPLGNGPYKIGQFEPGATIEWELVEDYWAKDLPVRKGRYNFGKRVYRYFNDANAIWQAFKKGGLSDVRAENRAQRWAIEYTFPAFKEGLVQKKEFVTEQNHPMVGWVLNQRRDMFKDRRVRKALSLALNFDQMNETLFFDQYKRINTYFGGQELSSSGLPEGRELEILEAYRGKIPDEVFTDPFANPVYESRRDERKHLRQALGLLTEAGWKREGTKLVDGKTGQPFKFEILGFNPNSERIHAPWINALKKLGIEASYRVVDTSQFIQRQQAFDFDVTVAGAVQSLSPGNEQRDYWSSDAADRAGSRNWFGLKDPVVDELIEKLIQAPDRDELVALTRALDRILLHKHLWVHQWYLDVERVAWWDKFGMPEKQPLYQGYDPQSWWIDPEKEKALKKSN